MAAAVAAGFLPPALALGAIAATGYVSTLWAMVAIAIGAVLGGGCAWLVANSWSGRAERMMAVAAALAAHRPPPHLIPDETDAMGLAERRVLEAADNAIAETESLAEQRDELEAILRSMTEAVVVTGPRGEVVMLNGRARHAFALGAEANYTGRDFVELCRDPRLQEFVARSAAARGSQVMSEEIQIQNPAPLYFAVSAAPVARAHRGALRVFVFHDITQLKSYENMRADFIANLTHEIRTPLAALYGYAETLERGVDDQETQRRFLGIIERQARRLSRLVDDLLSLSDLERGITPLKIEELEPRAILEEAAELMREPVTRAGINLSVDGPADLPRVSADRDRMHQVMLNLLDNASKYTPRGGRVRIEARSAAGFDSRPGVEFSVADTGEGIPAADIPRLTERFYRVDRARSRELGGTGLGLAIVKHIVQLHQGTLAIESKLREGTTVRIWIPCARP